MALTTESGWTDSTSGEFRSFAGANAVVMFQGAVVSNVQSITINTTREIVPLYVLGSAEPKSFNRNKRAIAGSIVMINFDRDMLIWAMKNLSPDSNYREKIKNGMLTAAGNVTYGYTSNSKTAQDYIATLLTGTSSDRSDLVTNFFALNSSIQEFAYLTQNNLNQTGIPFAPRPYMYADQLPALDIMIMYCNEDGATAHLTLRGAIFMNTAQGISIDDAMSEKAMTFVAQRMEDLQPGLGTTGWGTDPNAGNAIGVSQMDVAVQKNQRSIVSALGYPAGSAGSSSIVVTASAISRGNI